MVEPGTLVPDFTLEDQFLNKWIFRNFGGGHKVVLFVGSLSDSGHLAALRSFASNLARLKERKAALVAVTSDPPTQTHNSDSKFGLGFTVLSDPDGKFTRACGVATESRNGRLELVRTTCLLDASNRILRVYEGRNSDIAVSAILNDLERAERGDAVA